MSNEDKVMDNLYNQYAEKENENNENSDFKTGLAAIIFFALYAPLALLWASVFTTLWGWFVVPTFGAPELSIVQALGLSAVLSMFGKPKREEVDYKYIRWAISTSISTPLTALFIGWILTFFL